ncbi:MAG: hypothetical protein ABSG03_35195 [Bryobacteraceae bacterium]|jgi:hypothetical protein
MSLATVGCMAAQVLQDPGMQTTAPDAFQHLPPMPSQVQPTPVPVKMPLALPKPVVAHAQAFPSRQCAIPLLNVTPDDSIRYTLRKTVPQTGQLAAMAYVTAAPTCGDAIGDAIKK